MLGGLRLTAPRHEHGPDIDQGCTQSVVYSTICQLIIRRGLNGASDNWPAGMHFEEIHLFQNESASSNCAEYSVRKGPKRRRQ
jgi:hypothetical protein